MLTYGLHINQPNDLLQKVSMETIADKIKKPKSEFTAKIEQLRQVRLIDEKQYGRLKVNLPYFCCGIFNPPYRRKENFASINCFTLDFDHFSSESLSKEESIEKLKSDPMIRLLFTSPGGDGLKAVFVLNEPCTDAGLYSHFYKAFAQTFAKKYELEKVIDWVTHDVTRATFFSADENAWDHAEALPVKMTDYISEVISSEFSAIEKEFRNEVKENSTGVNQDASGSPDNMTLSFIKSKLNPGYRPKLAKEVYVPEALNLVVPEIQTALEKENIHMVSVKSINFGKQLKVQMEKYWAELNVFYGKRGYSIIRTTKTGSNAALGELAYQIIDSLLN